MISSVGLSWDRRITRQVPEQQETMGGWGEWGGDGGKEPGSPARIQGYVTRTLQPTAATPKEAPAKLK